MRIDHYFCLCRYSANTASATECRDHGLAINELWFSSLVILGPTVGTGPGLYPGLGSKLLINIATWAHALIIRDEQRPGIM